jgi:hypothetical protein
MPQLAAERQRERRRLAARHEDVLEERQLPQDRLHHRQQLRRHDQRLRPAVAEYVGVLLGRQQRVEAHRHDAGLDRAPERGRKVHRVEQQQRDARLARNAVGGEQAAHAVGARRELAVGQRLGGIDEGRLGAAPVREVAVDHVGRRVVDARIAHRSSPSRIAST